MYTAKIHRKFFLAGTWPTRPCAQW